MTAILVKRRQIADMDYRTLYFYLFNQITDAVEELDAGMYHIRLPAIRLH